MQKYFTIFILFLAPICLVRSQQSDVLDINNIKARVWCDGDLFWDKLGNQDFEFPIGSGNHANHLSGLWIIGKDNSENLRGGVTFDRANPFNNVDFYTGPLDSGCVEMVDSETMTLYNRVWKISRAEIEMFQLCNCINPGNPICTGYVTPQSIKDWPGNPMIQSGGEHLHMENILAPFYDNSGDGVYDWTDCDYPLIKGDQAIFWVMNDQGGPHQISGIAPMNIEIRAMAYASYCDNFMNDVVFVDYEIISRCMEPMHDVYIGMYSSADAGDGNDDWIGTNVQKGYMYNYGGINDSQYGGGIATATILLRGPCMRPNGIDDSLDIASIVSLTDTTSSSGAYGVNGRFFNDGIVDNELLGLTRTIGFLDDNSATGNPGADFQFHNYLRNFWTDNSTMIYGCSGYPIGACAASSNANFMYPGNSDPDNVGTFGIAQSFDWTEYNTGSIGHAPGQRRLVATTGPIKLKHNDRIQLTYAFMPSTEQILSDSLGIEILEEKVDSLLGYRDSVFNFYNINMTNGIYQNVLCIGGSLIGTETVSAGNAVITLFPNPTVGVLNVHSPELLVNCYELMDISGRILMNQNIQSGFDPFTVDLSSFASGMYYIILHSGTQSTTKKIIKL